MPTNPTRAVSVAETHLGPINASRKRAGLPAMTLAEAERAFADVAHLPVRAKGSTLPTGTNQASADALWGGIVTDSTRRFHRAERRSRRCALRRRAAALRVESMPQSIGPASATS